MALRLGREARRRSSGGGEVLNGEEQGGDKAGSKRKNVIFLGLVLGTLVTAGSQTIVSPAAPAIVAELGGFEHYDWLQTSNLLVYAVSIPIVGSLADAYGRRRFYIGGIVVFTLGSLLAGAAQGFWWVVGARAVQGLGMGAIVPLSQTILGSVTSARERGKYMGYLSGIFGVASVSAPLAGGWIVDAFSWRWLFLLNLPLCIAALAFVVAFFRPPHARRAGRSLDLVGFVTVGLGLSAVLLATSLGGSQYPWGSWQIVSLYAVGAVSFSVFLYEESRAKEQAVMPLRLWRSPVFALSNVANTFASMALFGAIYFVPLYAQGVVGLSATDSGAVLVPLTASMVLVSVAVGRLITRTGRYKRFLLGGALSMGAGYYLLARLGRDSVQDDMVLAMVVVGSGFGALVQTYMLVAQNAAPREDLGVATSIAQLSRCVGAAIGPAVFGAVLAEGLASERYKSPLPEERGGGSQAAESVSGASVGVLLDPSSLVRLPPDAAANLREMLAAAMSHAFSAGLAMMVVAFTASLFIKEVPLRRS